MTEYQQVEARKIELEYCKLWMEQSKLFWNRIQTASGAQLAILASWYVLKANPQPLGPFVAKYLLIFGLFILLLMWIIMLRDASYMGALRLRAGLSFPDPGEPSPIGRKCGYLLLVVPAVMNVLLLICF